MKTPSHRPTIAVLPFKNFSDQNSYEYFSDGITEEIINTLSNLEFIQVISRRSSFYFKNKDIPITQIGVQLNASWILEGSVRITKKQLRISAHFVRVSDAIHLWTETWDRDWENILEVQREIGLLISDKLRENGEHFDVNIPLIENKTQNSRAFDLYMKARYHFNKWNLKDVTTAIQLYEHVIELDNQFADAYVGLADAYSFMATTQFMPPEEAWKKTVENTHKAFAINQDHPGVHYQLANLAFFTDCNYRNAFTHIQKALQNKPGYPEAQQFMAFLYMLSGDFEKALPHLQFALGIDPLNPETLFYKAYYHYRKKDIRQALELLDSLLQKNPQNVPAIVVRAYCMILLKEYDDLIEKIESMDEGLLIPHEQLGILCLAHISKGQTKTARTLLNKLEKEAQNPTAFQAHSYLFLAYARLKRYEDAFELLQRIIKLKSSVILITYADPLIYDLVKDKRYGIFFKKIYFDQ
ncbi:MAG: hypothetical protein D6677_06880, partial [Calditrichaeota bacterium]